MKLRAIIVLFYSASLLCSRGAFAQAPTWSKDIAPILYKNCTSCHHPGALAPNSLMTYSQAYSWRYMIKGYVENNVMPPWPPDPAYTRLAHERVISAEDKKKIADWVTADAPEGNAADAPAPPVYTTGGTQLGTIDYSAKMPDYMVNTSYDLYRCFIINTNFTTDKFVSEIEVVPGNASIVHHVLVYEDTTALVVQKDSADAGAGYTSFFGTGSNDSKLVGEWVPGTSAIKFPAGMGLKLRKNTRLILQVHYPKGTYLKMDSTRVNMRFTNQPPSPFFREVLLVAALNENELVNGPLVIAPETVKSFTESYVVANNPQLPYGAYTILSVAPHMHLIGKKIKVYSLDKDTKDTVPFIRINNWDFKWQGIYNFRKPLKVTTGSTLVAVAEYDNTSGNPNNPNSPPVQVVQGEATNEEMMLVFFAATYYVPGDENLVIDGSPLVGLREEDGGEGLMLDDLFPNPAKDAAVLRYHSEVQQEALIRILSIEGKVLSEWPGSLLQGYNKIDLNLVSLPAGQYFINVRTKTSSQTKALIVNE